MSAYDHSKVQNFIGKDMINLVWRLLQISLGGNSLENASASKLYDFVKSNGGHTVITKVRVFIHR